MRLDRELTLGLFRPLSRCGEDEQEDRLPVLMYHSISENSEQNVQSYYRVDTDPRRFAEHLDWLGELGYAGVALEEALAMTPEERRQRRPVGITFDDGFRDFYTAAWPALRRAGCTATMYLPTGYIGSPRKRFCGKECLTWEEVRELRQAGIRFGSHTVNHPKLYGLTWREIEHETALSKEQLEQELQERVSSFAYPYAFPQEDTGFAAGLSEILRRQGYASCMTTILGCESLGDESFLVRRLPANACDDRALFAAKLEGAYDWLARVQWLSRWARRLACRIFTYRKSRSCLGDAISAL